MCHLIPCHLIPQSLREVGRMLLFIAAILLSLGCSTEEARLMHRIINSGDTILIKYNRVLTEIGIVSPDSGFANERKTTAPPT